MSDYMHLVGTEDVRRAANTMQSAAESMRQTYAFWEERLLQHQRFMDEWLMRYEAAIARIPSPETSSQEGE